MTAAARAALYAAPLAQFVAVRKQLAAEAKAAGDKAGAAAIGKLARPTPAAWMVNQLWRQAGAEWQELAAATAAIGAGDLTATARQRAALAALRTRAVELSRACDQPASDAALARLDIDLRALAANGWGEVTPGELTEDLEPPGFEAMLGFTALPPAPAGAPTIAIAPSTSIDAVEADDDAEARAAEAARAEAARAEAAARAARIAAARAEVHAAQTRLADATAAWALARAAADRAELAVAEARTALDAAERALASADGPRRPA